jgi:hypothetical protein
MGHFTKCCATNKSVRSVTIDEEQNKGFLGTIDNKCKAWTKKFCINNKELNFKIDTGADVTVISDNDFKGIKGQTLKRCPHLRHPAPFCWLKGFFGLGIVSLSL